MVHDNTIFGGAGVEGRKTVAQNLWKVVELAFYFGRRVAYLHNFKRAWANIKAKQWFVAKEVRYFCGFIHVAHRNISILLSISDIAISADNTLRARLN